LLALRQTLLLATAVLTAVAATSARSEDTTRTGRFPPGVGQPQVQAACGPCHAISVVTTARKSPSEWQRLVEVMITRGARVSDDDFDVVVDYLIRNFSAPEAGAAAANPRRALPNG
jgi:hypothetical protein